MNFTMNSQIQDNGSPVDFDDYSRSYKDKLDAVLKRCGETSDYFYSYKIDCLKHKLKELERPYFVLDFGSGIGTLSALVAQEFPRWTVYGYDISSQSIELATEKWSRLNNLTFLGTWPVHVKFDIIIAANVFHHVPADARRDTLSNIRKLLTPDGKVVIFEHNPWNPLTQFIVRNCEFDRDAILISASHFTKMAYDCGLDVCSKQYIVFFPNLFKKLRFLERNLGWFPLGAQYMLILNSRA